MSCGRPSKVRVIADDRPGPHRTDFDDLVWWLPVLGPTTSWLAYLLSRHAASAGEAVWDAEYLAQLVGLSGKPSKLWAALDRLDHYGVAGFVATDTITIRLALPPLRPRLLERLPPALAAAYHYDADPPSD